MEDIVITLDKYPKINSKDGWKNKQEMLVKKVEMMYAKC